MHAQQSSPKDKKEKTVILAFFFLLDFQMVSVETTEVMKLYVAGERAVGFADIQSYFALRH